MVKYKNKSAQFHSLKFFQSNKVNAMRSQLYKDWGDSMCNNDTLKSILKNGYKVVYRRDYMVVLHKCSDYLVWNTNIEFEQGHSHLKSLKMAKQLCKNIVCEKMPKTRNCWLLKSHVRTLPDCNYRDKIIDLIEIRNDKKEGNNYYININRGS